MTNPSRKSVSLSKQVRSDMLHSFFSDLTKEAKVEIKKIENDLALYVYNLIYGGFDLSQVPMEMLRLESTMPLPQVHVKPKKTRRKKGAIEPSKTETFAFRNFANWVGVDHTASTVFVNELDLLEKLPQSYSAPRYGGYYLAYLIKLGLVNKTMLKLIEARYIKSCKEQDKIIDPIVEVMDGVTEIIVSVRSTKGLMAAWPECEKYLTLPETSQGALMKVDIENLNSNLSSMYPPAEKIA